MKNIRKNHDAAYKAKVALEAVKGEKTMGQLKVELEWLKKKSNSLC